MKRINAWHFPYYRYSAVCYEGEIITRYADQTPSERSLFHKLSLIESPRWPLLLTGWMMTSIRMSHPRSTSRQAWTARWISRTLDKHVGQLHIALVNGSNAGSTGRPLVPVQVRKFLVKAVLLLLLLRAGAVPFCVVISISSSALVLSLLVSSSLCWWHMASKHFQSP